MRHTLLSLILLTTLQAAAQRYPYSDQVVHKDFMFDGEMIGYDFLPYRRSTVKMSWWTIDGMFNRGDYPAAQLHAMGNAIKEIHGILMTSPLLANLQGAGGRGLSSVTVGVPRWSNDDDFTGSFTRDYIRSHVSVEFNPFFKDGNGQVKTFNEHWKGILLRANDLSDLIFGITLLPGRSYVTGVPDHGDRWMGHPVFHMRGYDRVVVTRKGIPLYVPVSYREYMEAWFGTYEKMQAESRSDIDGMQANIEKIIKEMDENILNAGKQGLSAEQIAQMKAVRDASVPEMRKMIAGVRSEQRTDDPLRESIAAQRRAMLTMLPGELNSQCLIWDELNPLVRPDGAGEDDKPRPVFKVNPVLVDLSRPAEIQFLSINIPPYNERYDQEVGYWRNYWITWQVMKDEATWGKIIEKVKH